MTGSIEWPKLGEALLLLTVSAISAWAGVKKETNYPFRGGPMPPRTARIVGVSLAIWFLLFALLRMVI